MFVLIHVGFFTGILPSGAVEELVALASESDDLAGAFGAKDAFAAIVPDALLLAAEDRSHSSTGEFVTDGEVIEDIAEFIFDALLATREGPSADRCGVFESPEHFVHGMNGLFHDMITGKPSVVDPVAEFVFEVRPVFFARFRCPW